MYGITEMKGETPGNIYLLFMSERRLYFRDNLDVNDWDVFLELANRGAGEPPLPMVDDNPTQPGRGGILALRSEPRQLLHKLFRDAAT